MVLVTETFTYHMGRNENSTEWVEAEMVHNTDAEKVQNNSSFKFILHRISRFTLQHKMYNKINAQYNTFICEVFIKIT